MFHLPRRHPFMALALCVIVVSLPGAGPVEPEPERSQATGSAPKEVQCVEPRPQMCIQIYLPVCARLRDGRLRTYPSGCTACTDANVVGHRPDPCE